MGLMDTLFGGGSSSGSNRSFVDPLQQPFLDFLRNTGQGLVNTGGANQFAQQAGSQLYNQLAPQLGQLTSNPFLSGLQQQAGGNPALVQQQTDALGANLGQFWNDQIRPGIGRQFGNIGARGGSRQAVAENLNARPLLNAFQQGATEFATQDAARSLQAGVAGGGLLANGILGGAQAGNSLFNLGMGQYTGGFAPLLAYNQIVGPPTVLDEGSQKMSQTGGVFPGLGSYLGGLGSFF